MLGRSKAREALAMLPVFGLLLLTSPLLGVFDRPLSVLGVPLVIVYLFGVWVALIGAALLLSRRVGAFGGPKAGGRE